MSGAGSDALTFTELGSLGGQRLRISWMRDGVDEQASNDITILNEDTPPLVPPTATYDTTVISPGSTVTVTLSSDERVSQTHWETQIGNGPWSDIPGANALSYTLPIDALVGHKYRFVFSFNSLVQTMATLTSVASPLPVVTYNDEEVEAGSEIGASFSSVQGITGYQWQSRNRGVDQWEDIQGATSVTYDTPEAAPNGRQYRIVWTRNGVSESASVIVVVVVPDTTIEVLRELRQKAFSAPLGLILELLPGQNSFVYDFAEPIIPDYSRQPPSGISYMAGGQVERIKGTNLSVEQNTWLLQTLRGAGVGHEKTTPLWRKAGEPSISGAVYNIPIKLMNPGHSLSTTGYQTPTPEIILTPSTGIFPRTTAVFQQRRIFAYTPNKPSVLIGSRIGDHGDFFEGSTPASAFEFEIDSRVIQPISHLIPSIQGLVCLH